MATSRLGDSLVTSACRKTAHRVRRAALAAAKTRQRASLDVGFVHVYRCGTCRFPDGQRAWHWGHRRSKPRVVRRAS